MTTELTQKLENIISGHSINEDDADWLRALTQRPAAQTEREADGLPLIVAGAIFDFAGFMTTRSEVIEVGSTAEAGPVADLVKEWAELRGLNLADAAVLSWQLHINRASPPAPQQATPAQEVDWRTPTTYAQRFTDAVSLLCREAPPSDMVSGWIDRNSDDHRLQDWACERAPAWAQGIGLLDAAHVMASQPTEGVEHEPAPQQATPTRATREAEQRARMQARLATRHEGKATADFDLPAPNDAAQQATPEPVGEAALLVPEILSLADEYAEAEAKAGGLTGCGGDVGQQHELDEDAAYIKGRLTDAVGKLAAIATHPAPGVPEGFALVPMTEDQVWHNDSIMSANAIGGLKMDAVMLIVRGVEAHHSERLAAAQAKGGEHD